MKPPPFHYHDPATVGEAVDLLARLEDSKLLAGGQSLVPMLNMRFVFAGHLIVLNGVAGLAGISEADGELVIGAMTRQHGTLGGSLGGIAHGIGNALYERMGFDDNAQPITTNYGEYLLLTASEMPRIEVIHRESPSPLNALGVKGVGESGVIPTAAAIVAAVENALGPFNVRLSHAPLSPVDVVEAVAKAKAAG